MTQGTLIDDAPAPALVRTLTSRGETLAFCESLTAGLASATVATVPGASNVLRGGLVTYATELKSTLAGVPSCKGLLAFPSERYGNSLMAKSHKSI